jgi:hypothetical protein
MSDDVPRQNVRRLTRELLEERLWIGIGSIV